VEVDKRPESLSDSRLRSLPYGLDYVRTLDPQVLSYNDDIEDPNVRPKDILNYEYKDELSLDDWVYGEHPTDYPDVDTLSDDMYAVRLFASLARSNLQNIPQFWALAWLSLR
jgi:hypothetical protein